MPGALDVGQLIVHRHITVTTERSTTVQYVPRPLEVTLSTPVMKSQPAEKEGRQFTPNHRGWAIVSGHSTANSLTEFCLVQEN